ncbi:MAG: thioredoxin family protein [Candidatus Omnitrophica bacterium]|nr:thioredoxin family protein [Candidatus Omnitrophota bacterium]
MAFLSVMLGSVPVAWAAGPEAVTAGRFVLAFLAGLALNLTPCVYPLIPVTISFFVGQSRQQVGRSAWLAACYVAGLAVTYSALGLAASLTGGMLGAALQQPAVVVMVAVVMVAMGLGLCGLFELRVPAWLNERFGSARAGTVGALIMGLTVGIIAAPCLGPFVLGLLLYVGQLGRPIVGFWLFFSLALGLGTPYLLLGIFANQLHRLPKSGVWLVWVKQVLGCMLFGVALYLIFPLLPTAVGRWAVVALLVGCGVYLGWVSRIALQGGWKWVRWAVGALLLLSAVLRWPLKTQPFSPIAWVPYTASVLEESGGRPVLVDVYADWCLPCHEMDRTTYRSPRVVEQAHRFLMVKLDATDLTPEEEAVMSRYHVLGVPTLLVFDGEGRHRRDLSQTGYLDAEELLSVMSKAQAVSDRNDSGQSSSP